MRAKTITRTLRSSVLLVHLAFIFVCGPAESATLPSGFTERQIASGLSSPTAMSFSPDGRLFVCEQGGALRVIKNDTLRTKPFLTVTVDNTSERGLLGITFDPNFSSNHYVYIYYTARAPTIHNRVSRFTASGDTALPGSELALLDLPTLGASNHNGGAMHFGDDGKLYIAVGENGVPSNSQSLSTTLGKMLRMNSDGTIPTDNPYYDTTSGNNRLIWALGLRNPFTFTFQEGTGKLYINDVGQDAWEEIDYGNAGANYGWPAVEGIANSIYTDPMFAYGHSGPADLSGCAITGGAFYEPATTQFPSSYIGEYFFADYCNGWIRKFHPADSSVVGFATGISAPVDLSLSDDGSLYYLARGFGSTTGTVFKVLYSASQTPSITLQPLDQTVPIGAIATFTINASGAGPLTYRWQRNSVNITGATSPSYSLVNAQPVDNGALFRCVVTNSFGSATSNAARLTVTSNQPPTATITAPANGSLYSAGETINFTGTGTDPEQGTLPASALTWTVDFQHDSHHHPFFPPTSGITNGSFVIPITGETSDSVWYRIYLNVTDSGGLSRSDTVDIFPRTSTNTISTIPTGLQILLDGAPHTSPYTFVGVVGMQRDVTAVSPQSKGGQTYVFASWSDGGTSDHIIFTPAASTTYSATFSSSPPPPVLLSPLNGAANQPTTLSLRWTSSAGATSYRCQLATDSLFTVIVVNDSTLTDTSRSVSGLISNTLYFWRVNAKNSFGTGFWSTIRRFSTVDNIFPTVSITAPAPSATVANAITVSASASDNVGVLGVQFRLDGNILGAEDTTAPYSVAWNTLTAANGAHSLTAVARDGAGNATTSSSVSVTVANSTSSSDLWVYQESLLPAWINASWGGTVTFNSPEQSLSPPNSIKCAMGSYGGLRLRSSNWGSNVFIDPALYSRIEFSIYNTTPGLTLNISLSNDVGGTFPYVNYNTMPLNQWVTVSYPLSQLDPGNLPIQFLTMQSNSSAARTFYIDNIRFVGLQSIPSAPVLVTPANGATGQATSLTLRWNKSQGATGYGMQLATDSLFTAIVVNDSTLTDTSRALNGLAIGTTYYWRANAKNTLGTSLWSASRNFTTSSPAPLAPLLLAPLNGAANQPMTLSLRWTSSAGATSYRCQLSTDSLFTSLVVNDSTLTDTSRAVSGLLSNTLYFWRVNSKNTNGTSSYSAFRRFSTLDNIFPTVSITSPAPSATVANAITVSASASDNVGVLGVQFRLDGNIFGAEDTTAPYSVAWNTLTAANGAHSLTAVARDGAGNATTSPSVSVTVANSTSTSDLWVYQESLLPAWINASWGGTVTFNSPEQSLSPPNSIKCAMGSYGGLRLRSSNWGSNVFIDPALYSRIEFSIYNTTPGLTLNISLSNDVGGTFPYVNYNTMPLNQWVTVSYPLSQLDPGNLPIQFLTMQSNSSAARTFYIDNIRFVGLQSIPSAPVLVTPANGATGQATSLTLRWNKSQGATGYGMQLATDSLFTAIVVNDSTLTDTSRALNGLAIGTTYYWRANAKNTLGTSLWSASRNFTTSSPAPLAPLLLAPLNGAANQPMTLSLRWTSSAGATSYRCQLSTDSLFTSLVVNDSTLTDTSRAVSGLLSNTLYFWRVNSKNTNGTSSYSAFRRFSTLDNIFPTVSITSPAPSATVANAITVSASASDNVGVLGVQFRLDGNIFGAEDTTAPYSVAWNTLTAANGAHSLTAVARDGAGNATTSPSVSVTVANSTSTSDLWVYQESLLPAWINASWGGTVTFNSPEQSLSPPNSIKCAMGSYGGLRLRSSNWGSNVFIDPALYSRIEFSIYNTTPGLTLNISLSNDVGGTFPYVNYNTMPLNQWVTVSYPLSQLDPGNLPIQFLTMQSNSSAARTFYIDNIRFVGIGGSAIPMLANDPKTGQEAAPSSFKLLANYPNPFNPMTTITFDVPRKAQVSIKVYDLLGREVSILLNGIMDAGNFRVQFTPQDLPGGVYFARLEAVDEEKREHFVQTQKLVYVK